ncbi:YhjD/YihY/BrkB family envelope integrity protein [Tessaracoccus caeni]|uniref:YhjD/YihY/BrkB family envelope integrity protein n=1 Tax=Tessaracoccus caeni TaxID=3031239 RepID=UPI0023DC68F6|nr:YhjD/YihY/BrkB family envelope integrity protein [Tessaracoccus caeni]MDF1488488.1 YhjD/YihY/BrkB family envelope integrity protein [Tessaracoccus caeni]
MLKGLQAWWERVSDTDTVAHLLAATERYGKRLGPAFAGAITYFSVLSMVPILMFSLALTGMVLTQFRPDLLQWVQDQIHVVLGGMQVADAESDTGFAKQLGTFLVETLTGWRSLLGVALLTAAYSGANWVGNLKRAVRVMWCDRMGDAAERKNFFVELGWNLLIFLGLLLSVVLGIALAQGGSTFSEQLIGWLGWSHVSGISFWLRVISIALTFMVSFLLFAFLFVVLPNQPAARRVRAIGILAGALALTVIQQLAGTIMGLLSQGRAAAVFGPIIVLMLLLNVLASIILLIAAWIGTDHTWPHYRAQIREERAQGTMHEFAFDEDLDDEPVIPDRVAAAIPLDSIRDAAFVPEPDPNLTVRQDVAANAVKVGTGVGYTLGAATGLGIGAIIVSIVSWFRRR